MPAVLHERIGDTATKTSETREQESGSWSRMKWKLEIRSKQQQLSLIIAKIFQIQVNNTEQSHYKLGQQEGIQFEPVKSIFKSFIQPRDHPIGDASGTRNHKTARKASQHKRFGPISSDPFQRQLDMQPDSSHETKTLQLEPDPNISSDPYESSLEQIQDQDDEDEDDEEEDDDQDEDEDEDDDGKEKEEEEEDDEREVQDGYKEVNKLKTSPTSNHKTDTNQRHVNRNYVITSNGRRTKCASQMTRLLRLLLFYLLVRLYLVSLASTVSEFSKIKLGLPYQRNTDLVGSSQSSAWIMLASGHETSRQVSKDFSTDQIGFLVRGEPSEIANQGSSGDLDSSTGSRVTRIQERRRHTRTTQQNRKRLKHETDSLYPYMSQRADRPLVATTKGLVRGVTQKTVTGKFVDTFLGIPFAQPPIGKYRFRHPQPINPWSGELDASRMSSSCYQVNDTFFGSTFLGTSIWNANTPLSEDCLYLNVWTPFGVANATLSSPLSAPPNYYRPNGESSMRDAKRPVLVWIFGGGFTSGTSTLAVYEGDLLAAEEDIIVVSMNYRVSALGFLYLGRPEAPGNAGLFDQLLALQWISDNIEQFGGDPKRVTIFGESAGAVSAALHLLSPLSRNLFAQAILQSAAATNPWGLKDTREMISNGLQLASLIGCPSMKSRNLSHSLTNHDLDQVVECLVKTDPYELVRYEVGQTKTVLKFPFVPVVDGSFLVESPIESLAKSNFKQAKILLGSNSDEGNSFLVYLPELHRCPPGSGASVSSVQQPTSGSYRPPQEKTVEPEMGALMDSRIQDIEAPMSIMQSQTVDDSRYGSSQNLDSLDTNGNDFLSMGASQQSSSNWNNQSESKVCRPSESNLSRDQFFRMLREELNPFVRHPIAREAVVFEYSNWINPTDPMSNNDALDKMFGDFQFTCPVNELAQRYASAGNQVYMYHYRHRSSISPWPKWMGVLHGDEINFIFGEPLNSQFNYTSKEIELSRRMMKYWANFAKFG